MSRAVEVGLKPQIFLGFYKKPKKTSKVPILGFKSFLFTYCVTNSVKMIFKYELGFVAFTWPKFCSLDLSLLFTVFVGCNFVSGICKLKSKNLKELKTYVQPRWTVLLGTADSDC